jgi:hypothetical protein
MSHQDPSASNTDLQAGEQDSTVMRALTADELREIVGGPEIKNGGGGTGLTSDLTGASGG